ncbi:MAG TPA: DUF483 domain-containing protein [Hadesarchaea archaeon]|nr:DUF483 domain-containing protein [Hadesarchaea archaeon]
MDKMVEELAERLLKQPPTTVVDLVMTAKGLKTGAEILRKERDKELEDLIDDMKLVYKWDRRKYLVTRLKRDITRQGVDSVSRGRWFGIPECCIQNYQKKDKEDLRKQLSLEELKLLEMGENVPDEFYLGSMGYLPCSMRCQATVERGIKARAILEGIDPRLWAKFRNFHIRRRLVEYGGEIKSWREAK